MTYGHGTIIHGTRGLRYDTFLSRPMTSRIRLVGLSTATAKQQHRPRSTKLGAPSLWEVSIDPLDTSEGRAPLRGGLGGQGN